MTTTKTELHLGLVQANPHLGDVEANCDKLLQMRARAIEQGCQIILTPEMYLSGYPADDLVLRADFMDRVEAGLPVWPPQPQMAGQQLFAGPDARCRTLV